MNRKRPFRLVLKRIQLIRNEDIRLKARPKKRTAHGHEILGFLNLGKSTIGQDMEKCGKHGVLAHSRRSADSSLRDSSQTLSSVLLLRLLRVSCAAAAISTKLLSILPTFLIFLCLDRRIVISLIIVRFLLDSFRSEKFIDFVFPSFFLVFPRLCLYFVLRSGVPFRCCPGPSFCW